MKDITHYFQVPDKSASNISDTLKPDEVLLQKSKDNVKSNNNGKRKVKDSNENVEAPAKCSHASDSNGNISKENPILAKKRKEFTAVKSKNKKQKFNPSPILGEIENKEETVPGKRSRKSNGAVFDDDSSEEFTVKRVQKQYTRKKKPQSELINSIVTEDDCFEKLKQETSAETSVELRILLEDCMKTNTNEVNGNTETSVYKLEDSDSDSCFVTEKKPKKKTKPKSSEKLEEETPSGNNLLNYFSKVDKSQIIKKITPTLITVQAIIHSPPKDKSESIKPQNVMGSPLVSSSSTKNKKKSCNFDDIKVVAMETIPLEDVMTAQSSVEDSKTVKSSETVPSTPQFPAEITPKDSASKVQPWKMRVKLTPSLKPDGVIKNTKTKKYKKIIHDFESEEEIPERSKLRIENSDDDVEIVSVTKAAPVTEKPKPVKLAPVFCKKRENTKTIDYRIRVSDEAKRLFLESGVPEAIRKKMEEQKTAVDDDYHGDYVYPKCNHVQQKDASLFEWNLEEFTGFNMKSFDEDIHIDEILSQRWSLLSTESLKIEQNNEQSNNFDLKNEIALLKKQEPNVNISDMYCSIKKLSKTDEDASHLCWTEKYNPSNFDDMIGNKNCLYKLKEWIESHKRVRNIVFDSDQSSGDEFIDSDDSCSSADVKNNVAILVGPPGCGKTCAVYMLANELGFKVLEVNAGSNRTGKRIIDELLEATQSHRVKRTSDLKNVSEPKKIKKKKKNQESKRERKTMSLILIEDADILFENYDEGFLSALNSLASLSKRPLIFTANSLNYPHLQKYHNSQNLVLKFNYPQRSSINIWLKLIALTEGMKLSDELLMELYKIAGSDLRKNLLQLQMLISSKIYAPTSNFEQLFHQDWLSSITLLSDKKSKTKVNREIESESCDKLFSDEDDSTPSAEDVIMDEVKLKSKEERNKDIEALLKSAKFLNHAANLDTFSIEHKQKIFPAEVIYQYDRHENYSTYQLNSDLMEFLKERLYVQFQDVAPFSFKKYYNAIMQNTRVETTTENVFIYFNPKIGNHVAKNCDYLPVIRDIARGQRNKVSSSTRRTTRYFSYLKSVNIDISDRETDILCNTFL